ncbi:carbohydrate ABC transporter permease [Alicyclobacillus sp. SO9]|uniref:carbohydrate ABC transporter permease n=1 Tax=Alicyclobacillus sp. SO9 TaxID=2665646 RepID=UPI0018E813BA|nr:carbohydrate ABC transporter permease [Alicyclobacillus sp. SO9]QQE77992.1 carbohydrate ABC transporter permease [Alicyclobacillus sp. SO9]
MKVKKYALLIVSLLISAVMLFPLYWTITGSLETNTQIFRDPPYLFPPAPTLHAYASAFATQLPHLLSSFIVATGTTVVSLAVAAPAAYAITHFRYRGVTFLVSILLITQMIPGVSLANALFLIFNKLGLLNNYFSLILSDCSFSIPFDVLILRAFMGSIPRAISEAAVVDGAGDWRTFLSVIVPISRSSLVTAGLFAFLFGWGDFLFAVTMMTSNKIEPITVSIYSYISSYSQSWSDMMAAAVLASIPAAILLILSQRYITAGIASNSVKG